MHFKTYLAVVGKGYGRQAHGSAPNSPRSPPRAHWGRDAQWALFPMGISGSTQLSC